MKFYADIDKILRKALSKGGRFCDIFVEKKSNSSIISEENKIQNAIIGTDQGVGIRIIDGESSVYGYTNSFEERDILQLAEKLSFAVRSKQQNSCCNNLVLRDHSKDETTHIDASAKLRLVKEGNEIIRSYGSNIIQARVVYADVTQDIVIANSDGLYVSDCRRSSYCVAHVVAKRGDVIQTGYEVSGGNGDFEPRSKEACAAAAERALLMLDAKPIKGGKMPVVLSSKAGGTMVHEAIGHGLEADLANEGLSVYAGKVGKEVASPLITIVDDATIFGKRGTYNFDDEGTEAQKTVLVENGILKSYMYDRLSAGKVGEASTGNGRREDFRHRPIVRMTNTVIMPGTNEPESILKSVKDGLFVVSMGGGEVNTVNGDFVFEVVEGYKIEKGEVTTPVLGATLCGNGPEILSQIECVGSDLGYGMGVCGKDGQHAGVSDAQPTILLNEITVGGTIA